MKLVLNVEKFSCGLGKHKMDIAKLGRLLGEGKKATDEDVKSLFVRISRSSRELALAHAKFKCEKSGETKHLQFHHMIGRANKKITSFQKYATQRYYWANIVILAQKHHKDNYSQEGCITKEFINKVKKKYFDEVGSQNLKFTGISLVKNPPNPHAVITKVIPVGKQEGQHIARIEDIGDVDKLNIIIGADNVQEASP